MIFTAQQEGKCQQPQDRNLHMLGCGGSSSELPGKKRLSSTPAGATRVSTPSSAQVPSMAWAAPLELALTNIPRCKPSHGLFGAGEEQEQPGGAARPGHARKSRGGEAGAEGRGLEQILVQDLGDTRLSIQLCQGTVQESRLSHLGCEGGGTAGTGEQPGRKGCSRPGRSHGGSVTGDR